MRLEPDDDVFRFRSEYLGPDEYTLPFRVRYVSYVTGLAIFLVIVLIEATLPFLHVGIPPMWELAIAILATTAVMKAVDHDRPIVAVVEAAWRSLTRPRPVTTTDVHADPILRRVTITKDPLIHETSSPFWWHRLHHP